jgi:hypothetical protein
MTATPAAIDWHAWLQRWDAMMTGYWPDREDRFGAMLDALDALAGDTFVALDLGAGPGSTSQRLLARFPRARCLALDWDPVMLALGRGAQGAWEGGSPGWRRTSSTTAGPTWSATGRWTW